MPQPVEKIVPLPAKAAAALGASVPVIRKILYATDLSRTARHAARYACSIGSQYQAEVTTLHVVPNLVDILSSEVGIDVVDHFKQTQWQDIHQKSVEKTRALMVQRIRETSQKVGSGNSRVPPF